MKKGVSGKYGVAPYEEMTVTSMLNSPRQRAPELLSAARAGIVGD